MSHALELMKSNKKIGRGKCRLKDLKHLSNKNNEIGKVRLQKCTLDQLNYEEIQGSNCFKMQNNDYSGRTVGF